MGGKMHELTEAYVSAPGRPCCSRVAGPGSLHWCLPGLGSVISLFSVSLAQGHLHVLQLIGWFVAAQSKHLSSKFPEITRGCLLTKGKKRNSGKTKFT